MPLALNKDYKEASETVKKYLKDIEVVERVREIGEMKQAVVEVIGMYDHFDMHDMDMYHWKLKFEFLDTAPKTDEDKEFRAKMIQTMIETDQQSAIPIFSGKTSMFVYREVEKEVITKIDGKVTDTQKTIDWVDFTKEWVQRLQRQDMMMNRDF